MPSERPRLGGRFGRTAGVLIAALLVVTAGLTVANAVQGPRLRSADVNTQALVSKVGQRLVLRLNQPVVEIPENGLTVVPETPFSVTTDGAALTLRFTSVLPYATTFLVSGPVVSAATGASATVAYTFQTPPPEAYLLQRAGPSAPPDAPDSVVRTVLGSSAASVVHSEPGIQEYAVAGPRLAVVTVTSEGNRRLTVRDLAGTEPARTIADGAIISQLHSSGPSGVLGFVRTTPGGSGGPNPSQLQVWDPTSDAEPTAVLGLDGQPLAPQVWTFVPGTNSIVAQIPDGTCFLVDPFGGTPIQPLGSHLTLEGFVPGTTTLVVADLDRYIALDLSTGRSSEVDEVTRPETDDLTRLVPLAGGNRFLALLTSFDGQDISYAISEVPDRERPPRYVAEPVGTSIQKVCLSANGDLLAIERIPKDAVLDRNDVVPGYSGTTTVFLDTGTGQVEQSVAGSAVSWCP